MLLERVEEEIYLLPLTSTDQVMNENEETNTTNIIVPVVASSIVIILLIVVFAGYKIKIRTKQSGQQDTTLEIAKQLQHTQLLTINLQCMLIANRNSPYKTVETNQYNITNINEAPISGKYYISTKIFLYMLTQFSSIVFFSCSGISLIFL